MNKLKILKDLKYYIGEIDDISEIKNRKTLILHKLIEEQDLRKEAIEWIKHILKYNDCKIDNISQLTDYQKGQLKWIKYFFGIKDEEFEIKSEINDLTYRKMSAKDIDFEIGMERDAIPIYWENANAPIGYEDTVVDYYIVVYGVKVFIPKEKYKSIIKKMYKNE